MTDVFCNNCGHRNPEGSNFCSSCGQSLAAPTDGPQTVTFSLDQSNTGEELEVDVDTAGPGGVLVVTRGPNSGSEFNLEHVITTVGRHPDSDVFLDDVTVSRRHVEVEQTAEGYLVRDVGSLNGTYLNRRPLDGDAALTNGDELQVGRFKLVFMTGTAS